jgi:hypothetical protein
MTDRPIVPKEGGIIPFRQQGDQGLFQDLKTMPIQGVQLGKRPTQSCPWPPPTTLEELSGKPVRAGTVGKTRHTSYPLNWEISTIKRGLKIRSGIKVNFSYLCSKSRIFARAGRKHMHQTYMEETKSNPWLSPDLRQSLPLGEKFSPHMRQCLS